ncbi:hypothetical protein HPB49_006499 [Dermacentor silvarum]|uniref:Uncharacterized protein n=1 Tax=Dermacentor silvarum TaxID=543639 RepID=A0ACB8C2F3_DERSI|nr:hypothetical protein HPB49_006499 [Dermacentor silvarum]
MLRLLDYLAFLLLTGAGLAVGCYFSFRNKKSHGARVDEIFLGSKSLRMIPLAASYLATAASASGVVGLPAHMYAYGLHLAWVCVLNILLIPFAVIVVVPVFYELDTTSVFQYVRMRYNTTISVITALTYILLSQMVGAIAIFASSVAVSTVFNTSATWCSIVVGITATAYTAMGGLRGVVWADCLQALLTVSAPIVVMAKVSLDAMNARQRLTSLPLLCTVSECANEQTVPTMLSNAEETLTTDDKPATIGALSDRVPITEQTNDSPPGEDMDEDTPPLAIDTDTIEDEAYNGACWKVVRNKRRARNAAAHETASLRQNASEHPSAEPKQSGPKRLPPLPLRDEKVILRPLGGLRLDKWPRPTLATALWTAAGVSPNDRRDLILRTRPEQNLAIISTPSSHVADALLNIQELSISQRTYPVSAYLATPDDSCKGIVPGLEPGTPSHMLVEEMQASGIQILQARMMGQTNIALVTFEGLRVPRFVRFLGAELRCYPHRPRQPVCKTCLKLGHPADHCPTPDVTICEQCGIDNPIPSHPCSPRCKSCGGDHPTTEPKCPQRQRQPFNRAWVKKAIEDEQRQLKASTNAYPPSATTPASGISFKKAGWSRSKTPSRSRPKARVNSKSRSRSRSQSSSARNQVKRQTTPASQASPQPYKNALLNKLATSAATPDRQQARAPENTNAKGAPRELEAAIERTNARIQAAIESARQESLALRQEIISVIHASEERTHALFAELRTPAGFQIRASPATPYRCKKIAPILTPGGFLSRG